MQSNLDQDYIPKTDWARAQFWPEQLVAQINQMLTQALQDVIWNLKETSLEQLFRSSFNVYKELRNLVDFSDHITLGLGRLLISRAAQPHQKFQELPPPPPPRWKMNVLLGITSLLSGEVKSASCFAIINYLEQYL